MTAETRARPDGQAPPDAAGTRGTVAGNGTAGFSGDGGPAPAGRLAFPVAVAVAGGAVLVADHANHRVRRIDGTGTLTTVAGDGLRGFAGDGADATRGRLGFPAALAVAPDGSVLIADEMNHRIRRIDPSGVIDTVAGDGSRAGGDDGDGDGGPADRARLDAPCAVAVDGAGALYIGEAGGHRVRRVGADGVVSTVVAASGRRGGPGTVDAGEAFLPAGLAVDPAGQLYIADPVGRRVLLLCTDGTLRVLAVPRGTDADAGTGATAVDWSAPCAVAVDGQGAVYVADVNGHRVWRLSDGAARVVAGHAPAAGGAGDRGTGDTADAADTVVGAALAYPCGLAVDPAGHRLLVADNFHHRIVALPLTTAPTRADEPERKPEPEPAGQPEPEREPEPKPQPEPERKPEPTPPPPPAPPAQLLVRQEVGVEIARGESELLHVRVSSTDPWTPGRVEHHFTAPTGFVFDGRATSAYYRADRTVLPGGKPTATVRDGGRSLAVTDEPRLNTREHPAAALVYTLGIRALADAEPGRYTDGRAVISGQPDVRLKASVLGDDE
ncbi:serine/threonine protein kinase [Streptomyces sp. NPDC029006]|uniref:serine/threonine protein kinase n=1 Tax=Streptomyces sp. NPDC029006 TaxID=3155467 RepID=UPI0033D86757